MRAPPELPARKPLSGRGSKFGAPGPEKGLRDNSASISSARKRSHSAAVAYHLRRSRGAHCAARGSSPDRWPDYTISVRHWLALFLYEGGHLSFNKHVLPFWMLAFFTVPVLYKLVWAVAGRDSVGMSFAGLRLVDFDGNPPSSERRYQRMFGSFLSSLAAGTGLIWALVDEDSLTWHDHISSTFPTLSTEN